MAAHELRTPLTSVSGYVQLLYNRFASQETIEANWVKELYWESRRLNNLAKELLEINQVRTGKLSFFWAEYNFVEIINRSISALRFTSPNRSIIFINLTNKDHNVIVGDFDKLIQVITNILENAVKHSPADSLIEVVLVEKKKYYTLSVIDKGTGIPKKDIKKIGQEFYKGENSREEGMGLGLYIANYIISHHKGILKFKSVISKGTKVLISIPKILNDT
jgi:two-component system sensor histidine kinase ResE